jgi:DNA-binding XRE family transcriptional regulator
MTRTQNFAELRQRLRSDPKALAQIDAYRDALQAVLALNELREARGVTQTELAEAWEVSQANVSRVEHEQDLYLSTLSAYVAALGGQLELTAVFPDQSVQLKPRGSDWLRAGCG